MGTWGTRGLEGHLGTLALERHLGTWLLRHLRTRALERPWALGHSGTRGTWGTLFSRHFDLKFNFNLKFNFKFRFKLKVVILNETNEPPYTITHYTVLDLRKECYILQKKTVSICRLLRYLRIYFQFSVIFWYN